MSAIASIASRDFPAHGSAHMTRLYEMARRIAPTDTNILLSGESGTGKGMLARFLHDASPRCNGPFVTIACANIPVGLLESELFGHEKGAFTGASERRIGRFEQADGGTILIDGVGELAPVLQGKLLRVVQERCFERLAGIRTLKVDVRILSSTHVDLEPLVACGQFRKDLYYRLNVIRLELPPLRERIEDLPALVEEWLDENAARRGRSRQRLTRAAYDRLMKHDWPGNVRELNNVLEAAVIFEDGPEIGAEVFRIDTPRSDGPFAMAGHPPYTLARLEEAYIRETLRRTGGNRTEAARILGINRKTLLEKRKRYGIP